MRPQSEHRPDVTSIHRAMPPRSRRGPRLASVLLACLALAGCAGGGPSTSGSAGSAGSATAAPRSPASSAAASSDATAAPASPSPVAVAGSLEGTWRVRRVLAPEHRSALVPGATYEEQAFVITATCAAEPCPQIEVKATPLGRSTPVTSTVLDRQGDVYVSAAADGNDSPCLNDAGDRIPGGARVSSTERLWLGKTRPEGSAVESIVLQGAIEVALSPTAIGSAGGCQGQAVTYDLIGRREAVAVIDEDPPRPPGTVVGGENGSGSSGRDLVDLPTFSAAVDGAEIAWFDVQGSSVDELIENTGRGALRACGEITYEWVEGDSTPSACTITQFPEFDEALDQNGSGASCTLSADLEVRFTIHLPNWTAPAQVPGPVVDWWRETLDFIRDHEAGHVRISQEHTKGLEESLDGADCEDADRLIRNWARILSQAQEFYDKREYSKAWPPAPAGY